MTIATEHKDLPLVPESVLKRRHDLDDLKRKKQANEEESQKKKKKSAVGKKRQGLYVKKPETYLAQAKSRRNEEARYRRVKRKGMMKRASKVPIQKTKEIIVETVGKNGRAQEQVQVVSYQANSVGAPFVFAIRTREDSGPVPKLVFNILMQLRLKQPNTGVFLRYDPVNQKKLHLVEPWVIYGKPSESVVKDLMERKSFGRINGETVPLSDNTILERELGDKHGIICMEDLVHELTTVGGAFDEVTKFLVPFPLTAMRSKFEKEKLALKQGKDYGDKGEEIDEYIKRML